MDSAQLYRDRADHLRELASDENNVSVRQQMHYAAIRLDQFADELDGQQRLREMEATERR